MQNDGEDDTLFRTEQNPVKESHNVNGLPVGQDARTYSEQHPVSKGCKGRRLNKMQKGAQQCGLP
jgi:hypothetical protein